MATVRSLFIELEDELRFMPPSRSLLCRIKTWQALAKAGGTAQEQARAVNMLCAAVRLAPTEKLFRRLEERILELIDKVDSTKVNWAEFLPDQEYGRIRKSILLKPFIGGLEKGVIFISFEEQWVKLLRSPHLQELARCYWLVLAPTWCPPHALVNYCFPRAYPDKIFCLISNVRDLQLFPRLSEQYLMVPLLASNWVNPDLFQSLPFEEKDIDILMLANFGKYKRHHALFRALRSMPASTRVLLIGQRSGTRTRQSIMEEADAFGVRGRFELKESLAHSEVIRALARSKISLILSRREGSCVAVAESMFANTPVGMYEDAEVGSRRFINDVTGRFLKRANLAPQLLDFLAHASKYRPRKWVMDEQIHCHGSTRVLNKLLKQHALAAGQPWTHDIVAHHWCPDPTYLDPTDFRRFEPEYEQIKLKLEIEFEADKTKP